MPSDAMQQELAEVDRTVAALEAARQRDNKAIYRRMLRQLYSRRHALAVRLAAAREAL